MSWRGMSSRPTADKLRHLLSSCPFGHHAYSYTTSTDNLSSVFITTVQEKRPAGVGNSIVSVAALQAAAIPRECSRSVQLQADKTRNRLY